MGEGNKFVGSLLFVGLLALLVFSVYNRFQVAENGQFTIDTYKVAATSSYLGVTAPDFALEDLEGNTVRLSDFRGKVVVLNFWASWCPPCKAEMPDLDQIAAELGVDDFGVLLAVNLTDGSRETESKARQYIKDNRFSMPVLLDKGTKTADNYSINSIPTTFIIDQEGRIYTYVVGSTTKETLRNQVYQLK